MPRTSPKIVFGLYTQEVKRKCKVTALNQHPRFFSASEDLITENVYYLPYASYEPNFWLLDGNYKFLPENDRDAHPGLLGEALSDENGVVPASIVLTGTLSAPIDIDGFTIHFMPYTGDWASKIRLIFYDQNDAVIRTDFYYPDDADWSTGQMVEGVKKFQLRFDETNKPRRRGRCIGIDFGELYTFEGDTIHEAKVVEECDPTSGEMRIDTFTLRLYSEDELFNPINPEGQYAALTQGQPLVVYEMVDDVQTFIGHFFLDEWQNEGEKEIELRCVDTLGLLDKIKHRGGLWEAATVAELLDELLGEIPYALDESLSDVELSGWLSPGTLREAIQQVAFAAGAAVSCARIGTLRIFPAPIAAQAETGVPIPISQQGMGGSLTLLPLVSEVEVVGHVFDKHSRGVVELFSSDLAAGNYEILFDEPVHDLVVSGATITESGPNYALITVAAPGTVQIRGEIYGHLQTSHEINQAAPTERVIQVTDATLIGPSNLVETTERLFDYYNQRITMTITLFAPTIQVGQVLLVDALYNKVIRAAVESMKIDLARGMIAEVDLVGVEHVEA